MSLITRMMCLLGLHEWEHSTEDNHLVLLRRCIYCGARQRLAAGDSIAPTEYWRDA